MPERRLVEETIFCRTPVDGAEGSEITLWKFETVRTCIRALLTIAGSKGIQASLLPEHISLRLTIEQKARLGSVMWCAIMVQHEMAVSGEIEIIPDSMPPRLRLVLEKQAQS